MTIPSFYLGRVGGPFLFDCNYDINLLNLNTVPAFYIEVLKSWADAQGARERDDDRANPGNIILWNNKFLLTKLTTMREWNLIIPLIIRAESYPNFCNHLRNVFLN